MPLVILCSCTVHVSCNPADQSCLLCMTCFSFPVSLGSSCISILGWFGCSVTALPCLCTRWSPQRLPDKCTLIHNTCGGGLYIDWLIPPWPHCDMNSVLHQFKCVVSPTHTPLLIIYMTCSSTLLGWGKYQKSTIIVRLNINEESRQWVFFPTENYWTVPDEDTACYCTSTMLQLHISPTSTHCFT